MTDKMVSISGHSAESGSDLLQIEIPRQQLGSFLSGLLGQPRRTEKISDRIFSIDHSFLINLDQIIEQRVAGQQRSNLTSFTATIQFADDRTQTETSRDAFRAFNDVSLSPTTGVNLVWTYLIWFPNRAAPEKQEISLSISSDVRKDVRREAGYDFRRALRDTLFALEESRHKIRVRVSFTELTWGIDVLSHIENELKKSFVDVNKFINSTRFGLRLFFPFILFFSVWAPLGFYELSRYLNGAAARDALAKLLSKSQDFESLVNLKLDYLMTAHTLVSSNFDTRFIVNCVAFYLVVASVIIFALLGPKSYLLLNTAARGMQARAIARAERLWYGAIFAFIVGALAGVAGNKLTALIDRIF